MLTEAAHAPKKRGPHRERGNINARFLAILGLAFLIVVVLTHVAERWQFFPSMGWGLPNSPGHYLDLASAILGVALLVAAMVCRQISK